MQKKNGKKLEIPKGFRLRKEIKEIMVARLCYERWSLTINFYLRKEKELFNKVMDFLLPRRVETTINALYRRLPLKPKMEVISRMEIWGMGVNNHRYPQFCHSLGSQSSVPGEIREMLNGWNFEGGANSKLSWPVFIDKEVWSYRREHPDANHWQPVRKELLPLDLRRELAEYFNSLHEYHKDFQLYRELAQKSLFGVSSVRQVQLLNEKVYELLVTVANEYKPPCTDITVADDNAQLSRLM